LGLTRSCKNLGVSLIIISLNEAKSDTT